ncbi:MAG: hypothetical protein C4K58_08265 [Flavobacteriaceae bacterium]|nr:MAG: hypothetical protein C4K58_08265 [Flavobacteriaceae bacterium]
MKKYIYSFFALATMFATAQNQQATQKGNFLIEVNGSTPTFLNGQNSYRNLGNTGVNYFADDFGSGTLKFWSAAAEGGYYIADNLALIAGLGYNDVQAQSKSQTGQDKIDYVSYKVGAKYYALGMIPLSLDYSSAFDQTDYSLTKDINFVSPQLLSVGAGYAYFPNNNVSIEPFVKYGFDLSERKENMLTGGLGFTVHLGAKDTPVAPPADPCSKGDQDMDGVCDNWDKELPSPAGAQVDKDGVALDTDGDGIIDLNDKCVDVPGVAELQGCPKVACNTAELTNTIKGIEFDLNKAIIRPTSYYKLDKAAEILKSCPTSQYSIEGHTDSRGSDAYNQNLSNQRAYAVKQYLEGKGVQQGQLSAIGKGESDLLFKECNPATACEEYKNEANRRVIFVEK